MNESRRILFVLAMLLVGKMGVRCENLTLKKIIKSILYGVKVLILVLGRLGWAIDCKGSEWKVVIGRNHVLGNR